MSPVLAYSKNDFCHTVLRVGCDSPGLCWLSLLDSRPWVGPGLLYVCVYISSPWDHWLSGFDLLRVHGRSVRDQTES